tara:strand:- start:1726 stop:2058 length:333 start_codon:yes stop_codon:yes gene_type:complete
MNNLQNIVIKVLQDFIHTHYETHVQPSPKNITIVNDTPVHRDVVNLIVSDMEYFLITTDRKHERIYVVFDSEYRASIRAERITQDQMHYWSTHNKNAYHIIYNLIASMVG